MPSARCASDQHRHPRGAGLRQRWVEPGFLRMLDTKPTPHPFLPHSYLAPLSLSCLSHSFLSHSCLSLTGRLAVG